MNASAQRPHPSRPQEACWLPAALAAAVFAAALAASLLAPDARHPAPAAVERACAM